MPDTIQPGFSLNKDTIKNVHSLSRPDIFFDRCITMRFGELAPYFVTDFDFDFIFNL